MKGKGLSKTILADVDFKKAINADKVELNIDTKYLGFTKDTEGNIKGKGVLVCYSGDLNDIISKYELEPLWYTLIDGDLKRAILPNGIALLKLSGIIKYENIISENLVNSFNNGIDLIHIRKEFDNFSNSDIFKNTILPKEAYNSLKSIFHGGVMTSRRGIFDKVKSYDLISAHASNIVNEEYPIGKFTKAYIPLSVVKANNIFFTGHITIHNLRLKEGYLGVIYAKKCDNSTIVEYENLEVDYNGYIINAGKVRLAVNDILFECIETCYDYDYIDNENLYICTERGKLPKELREYVYERFLDKQTKPKDSTEYAKAKLLVNLCYGFLCRNTDNYEHYAYGHKLTYPYQWGVYTCLYTTLKIVKAMNKVVNNGGKVIGIATDSIKYIGDYELESGTNLGDLKYEGEYKKAYLVSIYQAVFLKENGLDVKLAGCIKEKAEEYFKTHSALDIITRYTKIPQGKVLYEYNNKSKKIEPKYFDYTIEFDINTTYQ